MTGESRLRGAYHRQKIRAKLRGIEWRFTLETWLDVWEKSGRLSERGRGKGKYVMARPGDVGPYSPENVEIIPHADNVRDARTNNPFAKEVLVKRCLGKGRGWTFFKNGYQVAVSGKYVGRFKTAEEAETAYKQAVAQVASGAGFTVQRLARRNGKLLESQRKNAP